MNVVDMNCRQAFVRNTATDIHDHKAVFGTVVGKAGRKTDSDIAGIAETAAEGP